MIAPVDVTNIRLETQHLILRAWREDDLQDFFEYASVDGVGQMAGWLPHTSIDTSRRILRDFINGKRVLALQLKQTGKVIGSLGLESHENGHVPEEWTGREIGYVLSREYWGRGLMPEAVNAVCEYCFEVLRFDYLLCGHFVWNDQSRRVIEKCGFQYLKNIVHETRYETEEETMLYMLKNPRA